MRVLVLGARGQLGQCLFEKANEFDFEFIFAAREDIDITNFTETRIKINSINPKVIINASAYTNVDKAEINSELADLVNRLAVDNIAKLSNELNIWLIHISTDYVFDGCSNEAYRESDQSNPLSVYGKSKLDGENVIKNSHNKYIILRSSWIYSQYGSNFLKTVLRLGSEKEQIKIVNDQFGCPTFGIDLAETILSIVKLIRADSVFSGIYHFCGSSFCSWYDFAIKIMEGVGEHKNFKLRKVEPISSSAFECLATRPSYSVLDCSKINNVFSIPVPNWHNGISRTLQKLL